MRVEDIHSGTKFCGSPIQSEDGLKRKDDLEKKERLRWIKA